MIALTGGTGFIGSALLWALNLKGRSDILVVDIPGASEKRKNLLNLKFKEFLDKDEFISKLEQGKFNNIVDGIIHMGAESSTTVYDNDYLMQNNCEYTKRLALWCIKSDRRLVYASSAATYGNGEEGFSDEHSGLEKLKPLNPYAGSKHAFDIWAYKNGLLEKIAGLKYFNCFGPNEYHKGNMRSMALQAFEQIKKEGRVRLFKSYNPKYKDGCQMRDFIYIKDAVDMTLFISENKQINGIFNIGTGIAQSFNNLAEAVFESTGKKNEIEYIDMPDSIKDKYQYFTQAEMAKLIKAGYPKKPLPLKEAVSDYVKNYLLKDNPHLTS